MNTKSIIPTSTLCAALCAALIATCSQASARPPQPRVQSGKIETVERDARILRLKRDDEAEPLTLVWNSRTIFVEGIRFVTAAELTKGARVTVWYRTPFFGKRFATKVLIERGAVRPKQQRPHRSATTVPRTNLR